MLRDISIALIMSCMALALTACANRPARPPTVAPTPAAGDVAGRPRLGQPIVLRDSPTILIPYTVETSKGLFEDNDPYTKGGSYGASMRTADRREFRSRSVRWHNVIARDTDTGEEWTILSRRGIIGEWYTDFFNEGVIVFIAVVDDTNRDGMLNNLDARVAIVTDANARNPRIITPLDGQVWSVGRVEGTSTLSFLIATDTNRDNRFNDADSSGPWTWRPGSDAEATPLVSEATLKRVEQMLTK